MATIGIAGTRRGATTAAQSGPALHVTGGVAALLQGVAVICSVVLFQMVQPAMGLTDKTWNEPARAVPFVLAHQGYFTFVGLFLVVSALTLPPILLALYARLRALSPGLINTAMLFGSIGAAILLLNAAGQSVEFREIGSMPATVAAQAVPYGNIAYQATYGAAQVSLGIAILLVSWVVIGRGGLPRWLGYFGVLVGITCPVALFGPPIGALLGIPWFLGLGIALLQSASAVNTGQPQTAG